MKKEEAAVDLIQLAWLLERLTGAIKPKYERIPWLILKRQAVAGAAATFCLLITIILNELPLGLRVSLLAPIFAFFLLWAYGTRLARSLLKQAESAAEEVLQDIPA